MLLALFFLALLLVGILIFRIVRRKPRPGAYRLHDVGTILDRSISAYRRHIVPILLLSILCLLVGSSSSYNVSLLTILLPLFTNSTSSLSVDTVVLLTGATIILNMLGIGKTILACGVVSALSIEQTGQAVTFGRLLPRQRLGAVIRLALLMIIPSVFSTLLGWLGGLFALQWMAAPAAMIYEGLGPWAAVKRSFSLVRPHYSALLNTIVPLWVISWLVVGTPLFGSVWLLTTLGLVKSTTSVLLLVATWIVGQICVAPVTAFGAVSFYLYTAEQSGATSIASEAIPIREVQDTIQGAG